MQGKVNATVIFQNRLRFTMHHSAKEKKDKRPAKTTASFNNITVVAFDSRGNFHDFCLSTKISRILPLKND
jgi:hypothetical protein